MVSARAWSSGVAWTSSLVAILVLSTMKGSWNSYCSSSSSRTVGLTTPGHVAGGSGCCGAWSGVGRRAGRWCRPAGGWSGCRGRWGGARPRRGRRGARPTQRGLHRCRAGRCRCGAGQVPDDGGGLAGQRCRDDPVAQDGLGAAAGAEVVRGPADGDLDPSGLLGGQELTGHPGAQLSFLCLGGIRAGLGQGLAGGRPVQIDVLHADQPGAAGVGGGQDAGLRGGNSSTHWW